MWGKQDASTRFVGDKAENGLLMEAPDVKIRHLCALVYEAMSSVSSVDLAEAYRVFQLNEYRL